MEKSLPPLPIRGKTPTRAPERLPLRAFLADLDQQQSLLGKVEQLGQQLADQQSELDEKDKRIAELTSKSQEYRTRLRQQRQAVVDLADAIGAAFQDYEQRIRQQNEEPQAPADARVDDFESCYAEVLRTWDDDTSSFGD
ncbi:uncharacterized protein PG986_014480 [Apiospora aurea]|uniref:Uncharacterized protein n=1 Tax=Apiospora aurea TaxID=335848 RepID=A0ABR1PT38_9PEZI